jgi:ketosteroid isomerase-like protein
VDRSQVAGWLRRYMEAWKSYDRAQIGELFSEGAEYRYHPYDDPVRDGMRSSSRGSRTPIRPPPTTVPTSPSPLTAIRPSRWDTVPI